MNASTSKLNRTQIGIIVLTITTAAIHLFVAFIFPAMRTLFILNSLGYLALLAAYFLPQFSNAHSLVRWALIAFTAVTIVGYFVVNGIKMDPLGLLTKLIEVVLIFLLWQDGRK
jgi:hypothetical protein